MPKPDPLDALFAQPVTFGLSAQKRSVVARMLGEGKSWKLIGEAMCWEPATLRRYNEREDRPVSLLNPYSDASHLAQLIVA